MRKFLALLTLLFAGQAYAQISKAGQAGAKFLSLPYSVRGESMGGAFTAVGDDPSVIFYNPAGAALVTQKSLYFVAGNWWGSYVSGISYVTPTNRGNFSVFMSGVYVGGIEAYELTADAQIVYKGTIAYMASQLGFGYSAFLTDKFAFGVDVKLIYEGFGGYSTAYSVAIDAGTYYQVGFRDVVIASSFRHFGFDLKPSGTYTRYEYNNGVVENIVEYTSYKLPTVYNLGISGSLYSNAYSRLKGSVEIVHPVDNLEYYVVGLEYSILNMVFVRTGYKFYTNEAEAVNGANGLNFGLGIRYGKFALDYGYYMKGIMPPINQVSILYNF